MKFVSKHPLISLWGYVVVVILACLWPFNFWQSNQARVVLGGGLRCSPPSSAFTSSPPAKLVGLRQFSVLLKISTFTSTRRHTVEHILSYALDYHHYNFFLEKRQDSLLFQVCYRYHTQPWPYEIIFPQNHEEGVTRWIAITYDGNIIRSFVNDELGTQETCGPLDFSVWSDSYPLIIGSDAAGRFAWEGEIDSLVVIDRPCSLEEMRRLPELMLNSPPVMFFSFTGSEGRRIIDQAKAKPAEIIIPERFRPYSRALLRLPTINSMKLMDIVLNIVGFMPLGFIVARYRAQKALSTGKGLALAVVTGLLLSVTMEVLQAYLPTRDSSVTDVISNTLGVVPGYYLLMFQSVRRTSRR